jgi:hypothetical protein
MWTLIQEGGIPMLVILGFGLTALGAAIVFARRPNGRRYRFVKAMARATLFATLVGLFADAGRVLHRAPDFAAEHHIDLDRVLLQGFGEATSPAILGFSLLALVALFTAVGARGLESEA